MDYSFLNSNLFSSTCSFDFILANFHKMDIRVNSHYTENENATRSFFVCLASIVFWESVKIQRTGELWNPHPIYHVENQTMFRPPHERLTELFKVFEFKSEDFHQWTMACWEGGYYNVKDCVLEGYTWEKGINGKWGCYKELDDLLRDYEQLASVCRERFEMEHIHHLLEERGCFYS